MLWSSRQVLRHKYCAPLLHPTTCFATFTCLSTFIHPRFTHSSPPTAAAFAVKPCNYRQHPDTTISILPRDTLPETRQKQLTRTPHTDYVHLESLPRRFLKNIDALFTLWESGVLKVWKLSTTKRYSPLYDLLKDPVQARALAERMVTTSVPHRAYRVLCLSHSFGAALKVNAYESVAHHLAKCREWAVIPLVVALAKCHSGKTTIRLLNWQARALMEMEEYDSIGQILNDFRQEKLRPNRRTFHLVISGHIRNRNLPKARETLTRMTKCGFPVDSSTHALIISAYRSLGPDKTIQDQALASLQDTSIHVGTAVLNSLIQLALDSRDMDGALQYLALFGHPAEEIAVHEEYGEDSIPVDGESNFNEQGAASSSLTRVSSPSLTPDITTFTIILNYLVREREIPQGFSLVDRVRQSGIPPDDGFIAALIHLHSVSGDVSAAISIAAGLCLKFPETHSLFPLFGVDISTPIYSDLISEDISPTHPILHALLRGVQTTHGLDGVVIVCKLMHACRIKPNGTTVQIVLSFLAQLNTPPRYMVRFLKSLWNDVRPTLQHLNMIASAVIRREARKSRPRGWYKLSRRRTIAPQFHPIAVDTKSFGFDPLAGIRLPHRLSLLPIIRFLSGHRVRSDRAMLTLRLLHDAIVKGDMKLAEDTVEVMHNRGMHMNQYHYAVLLEGFSRVGNMRAAEHTLSSARDAGVKPNVVMFTILIAGYARKFQPARSLSTFHRMLSLGITPDVPCIDAVVGGFIATGSYGMARRLLLSLWTHVAPLPDQFQHASLQQLTRTFRALHCDPTLTSSQNRRQVLFQTRTILEELKTMTLEQDK
ncbi:hypothetical protein C8Q75DRAFT_240174 [Abortiporus biennis]|nr:hypothetical protein C8Q75DRAFT_240174 [Abortiporus biennis]